MINSSQLTTTTNRIILISYFVSVKITPAKWYEMVLNQQYLCMFQMFTLTIAENYNNNMKGNNSSDKRATKSLIHYHFAIHYNRLYLSNRRKHHSNEIFRFKHTLLHWRELQFFLQFFRDLCRFCSHIRWIFISSGGWRVRRFHFCFLFMFRKRM